MANYATNIFHASTENKQDLDKIEAFLDDNFNGFVNRYGDTVDAEFSSRWEYPEKEIDELVASLEAKDKIYIPHTDIRVRGRIRELSDILARQVGH